MKQPKVATVGCGQSRAEVLWRSRWRALVFVVAILWHPAQPNAQTSIRTDASWGRTPANLSPSAANISVAGARGTYAIPGNVYTILEAHGRRAGGNLFHSFESFSVGAGDAAVFTTATPSLSNVISRVSGTSPTAINGLLVLQAASGSAPNFFFVNPNGVTFGAGAQVDVPAAFHVSTANSLKFADGVALKAGNGPDSTLTIAAPEAFGFLGSRQAAPVIFTSSDLAGNSTERLDIALAPGATFGVSGGEVQFASTDIAAPDGVIRVSATGNAAVDVPVAERMGLSVNGFIDARDSTLLTTGRGGIELTGGAVTLRTAAALSGKGSSVSVIADTLGISGGASIATETDGPGRGGDIDIAARDMKVEQLGQITAGTSGKGDAGSITITGERLAVLSGGRIEASTSSQGDGGSIVVSITGDVTVSGVSPNGQTRSGLFAKTQTAPSGGGGGGGGGGNAAAATAAPGSAGNITITARNLLLDGGAQIDSSTNSGGTGGSVSISAAESITVAGSGTRLTSDATRGGGTGGTIKLHANNITLLDRATVSAATGGKGDAGNIELTAVDRLLMQSASTLATTTSSDGKGGTIEIKADRVVLDGPGTSISAGTLRPFADLTITLSIAHPNTGDLIVQLDSPAGTRVALLSRVGGSGADFDLTSFNDQAAQDITSGSAPFNGSFKPREPLAQLIDQVATGDWTLNVRDQAAGEEGVLQGWTLKIGKQTFQSSGPGRAIPDNGALRSSITVTDPAPPLVPGTGEARGIGGDVKINASTVSVQNGANVSAVTRGSGKGGTVTMTATDALTVSNGRIATDTLASGAAGDVKIDAGTVSVQNGGDVSAVTSGAGKGGIVSVNATGTLTMSNGRIATDTLASGAAGDIAIDVGQIALQGPGSAILAGASAGSSGITGSLTVKATGAIYLANHAILSIRNESTGSGGKPQPSLLLVDAHTIVLSEEASITAAATGDLDAGSISIIFRGRMIVDPSSVTTSAEAGNGGDIDIQGSGLLWLDHSHITTSANDSGNGGDIRIAADILLMETGFIQANTGAPRAQGGDVSINAGTLLSSGPLLVGGETPFAFDATLEGINVIQAAAPDGVSGNVTLSTPALDIAGDLSALPTEIADPAPLTRDLCRLGAGSSLTPIGRGGLRPTAVGMIRPERALASAGGEASSAAAAEAAEQAVHARRTQSTKLVNARGDLRTWFPACVPIR